MNSTSNTVVVADAAVEASNKKNYEVIAREAKNAARDMLRTKAVSSLRSAINVLKADIESLEKTIKPVKDMVTIAENDLALLPAGDPRIESRTKDVESAKNRLEAKIKAVSEEKARLNESIAKKEEAIRDFYTGEKKVDKDELYRESESLIRNAFKNEFADRILELVRPVS